MACLKTPIVVMPFVYELPINFWRWCKLSEVCEVVPKVALLAGNNFKPSPETLVHYFAALVRPNKAPEHLRGTQEEPSVKKKIFRYSQDGMGFWGTEVPVSGRSAPPYTQFQLGIPTPYPTDLFVPEGWVLDTLKAIRKGAICAADFGDFIVGFRPEGKNTILLQGKAEPSFIRIPESIR